MTFYLAKDIIPIKAVENESYERLLTVVHVMTYQVANVFLTPSFNAVKIKAMKHKLLV